MNPKEAEDRERLEKMTMKELKAVAKDEGICLGYDGSRKANAVGLILEWRRFNGAYFFTTGDTNDLPKMSQ